MRVKHLASTLGVILLSVCTFLYYHNPTALRNDPGLFNALIVIGSVITHCFIFVGLMYIIAKYWDKKIF